jgi:uncharacterized glyoxalase superfamily protein PhnB
LATQSAIKIKQIFPSLHYQDPDRAIQWMVDVLGMEKWAVHRDNGKVVHAEIKFGGIIVHLGPMHSDGPFASGPTSEGPYVAMEGVDALYERAMGKGATIVQEINDKDYGSRDFALMDPEGRVWSFGTYISAPEPHVG